MSTDSSAIATLEKKIAIVGFTSTKYEAPWDDPTWEKWGLNNLHNTMDTSNATRWFDLHPESVIERDPQHVAWLKQATIPVYVWTPNKEWPSSVAYPKEEVLSEFVPYFTNSISWMLALAIKERATHIGIWGVDMAHASEYAAQRPSCEFYIGLAMGLGIEISIPDTSDLLKAASMYGAEDSPLRKKLEARQKELQDRLAEIEQQLSSHSAQMHQLRGAIESNSYILNVWTQPEVTRIST